MLNSLGNIAYSLQRNRKKKQSDCTTNKKKTNQQYRVVIQGVRNVGNKNLIKEIIIQCRKKRFSFENGWIHFLFLLIRVGGELFDVENYILTL